MACICQDTVPGYCQSSVRQRVLIDLHDGQRLLKDFPPTPAEKVAQRDASDPVQKLALYLDVRRGYVQARARTRPQLMKYMLPSDPSAGAEGARFSH